MEKTKQNKDNLPATNLSLYDVYDSNICGNMLLYS